MSKRLIVSTAALFIALACCAAYYLHWSGGSSERLVNVGGSANQCECSKRIER